MGAGTKPRHRAKQEADATRAAGRADAARRVKSAEAERQVILTEATHRASVIVADAKAEAAREAARLRNEALEDAKRIREEAVEEIVKLMSTLTTERDHILADARDDARRIVDAVGKSADSKRNTVQPSAAVEQPKPTSNADAAQDQAASKSELDKLFFAGAPEPAPVTPASPLERRRKKRFGRRH